MLLFEFLNTPNGFDMIVANARSKNLCITTVMDSELLKIEM